MRTAQPTRPAVRARMFWPRQPASRVPQAPANAAGRLPYLPLGCACLFLLGYLPGIWLGRTGAWESGSQLAAYYLSKSSYSTVFSVWQWQFSAAFLQLAALYLCSFSALGCFFLPILFFLRGGFLGLCAACVLAAGESRGLVCYWLLSSLSNLSVLFAGLWRYRLTPGNTNPVYYKVPFPAEVNPRNRYRITLKVADDNGARAEFVTTLSGKLAGTVNLVNGWLSVFLAGVLL